MGAIYVLSVAAGITMVLSGNEFALAQRDNLVGRAQASDPSLLALHRVEFMLQDQRHGLVNPAVLASLRELAN